MQAQKIIEASDAIHLSTRNMVRAAIQSKTDLGLQAKAAMKAHTKLPDELIFKIALVHLEKLIDDGKSFLLDGFPRTLPQAEALDEFLLTKRSPINRVIQLRVEYTILEERILGRLTHEPSGRIYHVKFKPPSFAGKDDITGEPLTQHPDSTEDRKGNFKTRIQKFRRESLPVLKHYQFVNKEMVKVVDANTTPKNVWKQISPFFQR